MILIQVGNEIVNIEPGLYTVYCGAEHVSIVFDPATRREPMIIKGPAAQRVWNVLSARAIVVVNPEQAEC